MSSRHCGWLGLCVLVVGCAADGDGTGNRSDGGGVADAGDGGSARDGSRDAAAPRPDSSDGATPSGPTIDGVLGSGEWDGATSAANAQASSWGASNALTQIRAILDDGFLYIALEGQIESSAGNAIIVYVDGARGAMGGVANLFDLSDGDGELDDALSAGLTTAADFRADVAWGTKDMGRAASGFDGRMGWRDVATNPADFAWVDSAEAPTVCSATVCETRIPRGRLGATVGLVALFARITNVAGTDFSNQTLPEDQPAMPAMVTQFVALTP